MAKKKARKKAKKAAKKKALPKKDFRAEQQLHHFLTLWNKHIKEQIKIHQYIVKGKESLKHHVKRTESAHKKFLKQLAKL